MATRLKSETPRKRHLWRENHGNFLAAFAALMLILSIVTILYQQMRFRPPAFPRRPPSHFDPSASPDDDSSITSPAPFDDEPVEPATPPEAGTELEENQSRLEEP